MFFGGYAYVCMSYSEVPPFLTPSIHGNRKMGDADLPLCAVEKLNII